MEAIISEHAGAYRVNLPVFEGPLDLLLYLIKKHDLPISDIPMAVVTEEYLRYLDTMEALNIDLAGEFLVMASELLHIKSQMLLPIPPAGEEEEEDPRADLVRRLVEYQRFKEAAQALTQRPTLHRDVFVPLQPERPPEPGAAPVEGNVYHLIEAFDRVLTRMPKATYHTVAVDRVSVNQRIFELVERILPDRPLALEELLPPTCIRYDIVVTFLALLEMARLNMIAVYQAGNDAPIYIVGKLTPTA
ncbi:MAG: segregation/condensation protein A [Deltaproteobacteria bacterium]|nr:segregation/condensation protein A [Deltaproteobacteria bacterium]